MISRNGAGTGRACRGQWWTASASGEYQTSYPASVAVGTGRRLRNRGKKRRSNPPSERKQSRRISSRPPVAHGTVVGCPPGVCTSLQRGRDARECVSECRERPARRFDRYRRGFFQFQADHPTVGCFRASASAATLGVVEEAVGYGHVGLSNSVQSASPRPRRG